MQWCLNNWIDFQKEYSEILGIKQIISLDKAVNSISSIFEGRIHDALYDARNTAKIYALAQNEKKFKTVMKPILELFQPTESITNSLGKLIDMSMFDFAS